MIITSSVKYIGVNDYDIDLFEGQYPVPRGMAYNSYLIIDGKTAVMDTVDVNFGDKWLKNLAEALNGRNADYLVVHHMEPDHSANVLKFMNAYPGATIVASAKAFTMMRQFFGDDFSERRIVVSEGSELKLGEHTLKFVAAPMVHWPEVMFSYDVKDKILFSADAFGSFGALDKQEDDWACEARRYYIGIVGKYGAQVQSVLKKAAALDIERVCPLHGPVLDKNLGYYLGLYNTWSSYTPEAEGVFIAYTSVYGNTKEAALLLKEKLLENGAVKVTATDLARDDMTEAFEDAFKYGKIVLATTTYNGDIFPFMRTFIDGLIERNFQSRTVAFIENGSWAPTAAKVMAGLFEKSKNITFAQNTVKIFSALNDENRAQIEALAKELCK